MSKVCRLCLQVLQRGSKYFNINAVETNTGFMPYRDQLTTCIPEIALDLIPNPVICNYCRTNLRRAYEFKNRCLKVEQTVRQYVQSQPPDSVEIDLIEISRIDQEQEPEIEDLTEDTSDPLEISKVGPIEPEAPSLFPIVVKTKKNSYYLPKTRDGSNVDITAQYTCSLCDAVFSSYRLLEKHGALHEDFTCNFCSQSFRSLQHLRKHNTMCQRRVAENQASSSTSAPPAPNTLAPLVKRPHLPTKAKNHLKRWLFRHTDHPYPTDQEKQTLMKETDLTLLQVENWFINARRRILHDLTKLKRHSSFMELEVAEPVEFQVVIKNESSTLPTNDFLSQPSDDNSFSIDDMKNESSDDNTFLNATNLNNLKTELL